MTRLKEPRLALGAWAFYTACLLVFGFLWQVWERTFWRLDLSDVSSTRALGFAFLLALYLLTFGYLLILHLLPVKEPPEAKA